MDEGAQGPGQRPDPARKEINARNAAREQERAALRDELRTIQQQIQQIQALIRRGVEKVKETVKGLVRGPQSDHADTPDEPADGRAADVYTEAAAGRRSRR